MDVKVKEYFEKTRHVKTIDKSKNIFYVDKEMQDVMNEFYLIKRNLINYHNFINFLKGYNKYNVEFFNLH